MLKTRPAPRLATTQTHPAFTPCSCIQASRRLYALCVQKISVGLSPNCLSDGIDPNPAPCIPPNYFFFTSWRSNETVHAPVSVEIFRAIHAFFWICWKLLWSGPEGISFSFRTIFCLLHLEWIKTFQIEKVKGLFPIAKSSGWTLIFPNEDQMNLAAHM